MEDENFFEKCKTCQHCYTKNDDDYVYCRKKMENANINHIIRGKKSWEVSKMQKYKCIKEFYIPKYDENDSPTDEYVTIHKGSIYEYTEGYIGESDIRLYLEDGDDNYGYLDITYERLNEYFERIA